MAEAVIDAVQIRLVLGCDGAEYAFLTSKDGHTISLTIMAEKFIIEDERVHSPAIEPVENSAAFRARR